MFFYSQKKRSLTAVATAFTTEANFTKNATETSTKK